MALYFRSQKFITLVNLVKINNLYKFNCKLCKKLKYRYYVQFIIFIQ